MKWKVLLLYDFAVFTWPFPAKALLRNAQAFLPYQSRARALIQLFSSASEARAEKRLPGRTFAPLARAVIRACPSPS